MEEATGFPGSSVAQNKSRGCNWMNSTIGECQPVFGLLPTYGFSFTPGFSGMSNALFRQVHEKRNAEINNSQPSNVELEHSQG